METLWFIIVAFMLAMYVILDGFDLGAGVIHLLVTKSEKERETIIKAIGPVWDGNEVWLLAAGGALYSAFPLLYASSFSGFYLPLMIVLWLLMLRGLGIELRHQIHHPMWVRFWDTVFSFASILLTIFFGAALGNVVRGVPLNKDEFFFEPLWTTFTVVPEAGILDWFTVSMGLVALFTLTTHGANYIAMKTEGEIQVRSRKVSRLAWLGTLLTSVFAFTATWYIHPEIWENYSLHLLGFTFPVVGLLGLFGTYFYSIKHQDTRAFLCSSLFIGSMLASTAFGLYPKVLPSSTNPEYTLTIYNTAAQSYGLSVGLAWWLLGILFAGGYFVFVYRAFRGKVSTTDEYGGD
ncbi:MAG: cytochrome d ubiquinol oxidase subunit II [Bacteroidetes bacterium]|nr:MAG: cytochrome d ubiquinol oxidase subunit II [Bacteroidota bacterium]